MRAVVVAITLMALMVACGGGDNKTTNETSATSTPKATATTQAAAEPTATTAQAAEPTSTTAPSEPTNTAAPTGTPRPTNTPAPTATATVEAVANVEVVTWAARPNTIGGYQVFGIIQNNGTAGAQEIQVVVSLYDAAGTILGSGQSIYALSIIPAGGRSGFYVPISDIDPATVAETKFQVQFAKHDPTSYLGSYDNVTDLQVTQINWTADKIVGTVQNNGDKMLTFVEVLAVGLNADGTVMGVEHTYVDLDEVGPGVVAPFDIGLFGQYDGAIPASIESWASGSNP